MKWWKTIGLLLLGIIIIIGGGVYFLVASALSPETVELHVIPRLEEILKRPIAFGRIRIGMDGAIIIQDMAVESGEPQKVTPLITSPKMVLRCRILPLLSKKIIIDRIELREPQIRLSRDAEGRFSMGAHEGLPASRGGAESDGMAPVTQQPPVIFTLNHLLLQDGTLIFTDYWRRPSQPLTTTCKKISADIADFSVVSPFSAALSAEVGSTPPGILRIRAMIDPVRKQVTSDIKLTALDVALISPYIADVPFSLTGGRCSLDIQVSASSAFDVSSQGTILLRELGITTADSPQPQLVQALAEMAGNSEIGVNHRLSYQAAKDTLVVEQCAVSARKINVLLKGKVESLSTDPLCDIAVNTDKVSARTMLNALPADMQPAVAHLSSGGAAEAGLTIKGYLKQTDGLSLSGFVLLDDLSLQSEAFPRWNIKLSGKTEMNRQDVVMDQLTATTGTSAISLTGKAANCFVGPLTAQLRISSPSLDVEEVRACITELGNLKRRLWDKGPGGNGESRSLIDYTRVSVDAEAAVDRLSYRSLTFSGLKAISRWAGNSFTLESLQGVMGDGAFTASGLIKPGDEGLDYTCRFTGNHLPLTPVLQSLAPGRKESISGSSDLAVNLQGRGMTTDDFSRSLAGEGTFTVTDGKVSGLESLESLASFIKIDALNSLSFDRSYGTFQVGDGTIRLQGSLKGKEIEIYPAGTIGLDAVLDLVLDMRVAPQLSDQIADGVLTRYFKDDKGWTVLSLAVKGPAGEAVVMPASSTIKNISEMLVDILLKKEESAGKVREDKKKALEDLLQRLMQKSKDDKGREDGNPPG